MAGEFVRSPYIFRDRVEPEPGRYHLYMSPACPWSHRVELVRRLKGLHDVVSMSIVEPERDERGWAFSERYPDPVNGFRFLSEAYMATDPDYSLRVTVPALWDRARGRIASNHFDDLTIQLCTQFDSGLDLYPEDRRAELDELDGLLYEDLNDGVYRAGFSTSQEAYERAFDAVFARLDWLEESLGGRRYLAGDLLTESDLRLFVTLLRFDAVYHYHFKCNLRRLVDYPNLWGYARELYQMPEIRSSVDFDHIRRHYYRTHPQINPSRIVPKGPEAEWDAPHARVAGAVSGRSA